MFTNFMVFATGVTCGIWYMSFSFRSEAGIPKEKLEELRQKAQKLQG